MTITTKNINGRADWYMARAQNGTRAYIAFELTRHAAFMAIAQQLAVAGIMTF